MAGTPLPWLAALLVAYLLVPIGAFLVRLAKAPADQLTVSGIGDALGVSVVTATVATVVIGVGGMPLGYLLARAAVAPPSSSAWRCSCRWRFRRWSAGCCWCT